MARRTFSRRRNSRSSRSTGRRRVSVRRTRRTGTGRRRYAVARSSRRARAEVKVISSFPITAPISPAITHYNAPGAVAIRLGSPSAAFGTYFAHAAPVPPATNLTTGRTFNASEAYLLTGCAGGYAVNQRIGLSIQPRTLQVRLTLCSYAQTKTDMSDGTENDPEIFGDEGYVRSRFRIVVFRDREYSANLPTTSWPKWEDIFTVSPAAVGNILPTSTQAYMRLDTAGRFELLSDRSYQTTHDDPIIYPSVTIPLRGTDLRFTNEGYQSVRSGHVFMLIAMQTETYRFYKDAVSPPVLFPSITYESRLSYTDA